MKPLAPRTENDLNESRLRAKVSAVCLELVESAVFAGPETTDALLRDLEAVAGKLRDLVQILPTRETP